MKKKKKTEIDKHFQNSYTRYHGNTNNKHNQI